MNAEIGIDEEGRAYVALTKMTQTEMNAMRYFKAFLPVRFYEFDGDARVLGDRVPGSGKAER